MSEELDLLSAWRIGAVHSMSTPETGTINRTLLVDAVGGSYVLRAYRHAERAPVEREHAVIAHVCMRRLPAVAPLPLPSGATILERAGRFYALFPRAPGRQLARGQLTKGDFAAMGAFLARIHDVLRDFPLERAARRDFAIDRVVTLMRADEIADAIRARPSLDDVDRYVLDRLAARRAWIEQSPLDTLPDLSAIEQQVIHGDYQETNLFFRDGCVVAIIDWDQTYPAPCAWEIVRALHLSCKFAVEPCRAFLAAYREQLPLDPDELDLVAQSYGLMRAHDLWLYRAIYFDGNDRLRQFVTPNNAGSGEYAPIMDRWDAVRRTL
jgi:Ser/Thr protein kinase RdoA (MazF antagonist)